jgi:hypothetical protein
MKRWRSDGSLRSLCVAAALALLVLAILVGRPGACSAEPAPRVSESLSQAKLRRVGDYIRQEITVSQARNHCPDGVGPYLGPDTKIARGQLYFPGDTSGFGLGFAVRTAAPANTSWPTGEYRWDGVAGTFFS